MAIKISLLGLTRSNDQVVRLFIESERMQHLTLSNQDDMQAAIVDADNLTSNGGRIDITQLKIPLIYLSDKEIKKPNVIWVKKPISQKKIINAAKTLNKMFFKKNLSLRDISSDSPQIYDPQETLQGYLCKAIKLSRSSGKPIIIDCQKKKISVDAVNDLVNIGVSPVTLKALCRFTLKKDNTQLYHGDVSPFGVSGIKNIQQFQWEVALLCARGRIPNNVDINQRFQLSHWPNLTLWQSPNTAMRICALWEQSSLTPLEVCRQLDIDQADVFSVFVAAQSAGLLLKSNQSIFLRRHKPVDEARKVLADFFEKVKRV